MHASCKKNVIFPHAKRSQRFHVFRITHSLCVLLKLLCSQSGQSRAEFVACTKKQFVRAFLANLASISKLRGVQKKTSKQTKKRCERCKINDLWLSYCSALLVFHRFTHKSILCALERTANGKKRHGSSRSCDDSPAQSESAA